MIFSKYIMIHEMNGRMYLHNTLYNSIMMIEDKYEKETFLKSYNVGNANLIEGELKELLVKSKCLIEDPAEEDEYLDYLYIKKSHPNRMHIILIVTRDCNFRCPYCYEKHEKRRMDHQLYKNIIKYIVEEVSKKRYKEVLVDFFGGEPMLEYSSIVRFLEELHIELPTEVKITGSMTTNGYLLNGKRFARLRSLGVQLYQVTIDGNERFHNETRVLINGAGTWDVLMNNLYEIRCLDDDFKIILRTNYTKDSFLGLDDYFKYMEKLLNNDSRFIYHIEPVKVLSDESKGVDKMVEQEEASINVFALDEFKQKYNLNFAKDHVFYPFSLTCYASDYNTITVDVDGSIRRCTVNIDDDKYNKIGYFSNKDVYIDHIKNSKWTNGKLTEKCKKCSILPICYGKGCPLSMIIGVYPCDIRFSMYQTTFLNYIKRLEQNTDE